MPSTSKEPLSEENLKENPTEVMQEKMLLLIKFSFYIIFSFF